MTQDPTGPANLPPGSDIARLLSNPARAPLIMVILLFVYIVPVLAFVVMYHTTSQFRNSNQTLQYLVILGITDPDLQQIFQKAIMPILIGITGAGIQRSGSSFARISVYVTIFVFSIIFVATYWIDFVINDSEIKTRLDQIDLRADSVKSYAKSLRDSAVASFTILLGLSVSGR